MSWSNSRKEKRLNATYDVSEIIDSQKYNFAMGAVIFEGLFVNYLLCKYSVNILALISPLAFLIVYIVSTLAGMIISRASHNAIISFIGYNMVVLPIGLGLSLLVGMYGGSDSSVVQTAFLYTSVVTATMIIASFIFKDFFASIGKTLFVCLIGFLICEIVSIFVGIPQTLIAWIGTILFSLYIGYDLYRSQQYEKTYDNAVDCALDIYLDIVNLFINILKIVNKFKN